MGEAWLYAVITTAVAAVMAAATWRPRPGQAAALLIGPVLSVAAVVGAVSGGLGLLALLVVPFAYLLVAAALPWQRLWAQWAVPATVMVGCLALAASGGRGLTMLLVLAIPFTSAAVGLARLRHDRRAEPAPGDGGLDGVGGVGGDGVTAGTAHVQPAYHEPSASERLLAPVVVAATALQGVAGLALVGYAGWGYLLEKRHPSTGPWAGAAYVILGGLAVLGLALAAGFFALAVALRRRYPDFRRIFVVVQLVSVALLVGNAGHPWTVPGIAWGLGTAALALVGRDRRATAPPGLTAG
ncbi:hypothetical protein [Intrasporangium flavum]|uniref:hypothetical protein n=1 Tax=Intrasporangium flavum TaxID=1428657 RepID=UPI00096D5A27|nr:hypothetical protein [Intrasporangium flavum]